MWLFPHLMRLWTEKGNGFIGWMDYELKALDNWNKIT
jgi:hypothetical protein